MNGHVDRSRPGLRAPIPDHVTATTSARWIDLEADGRIALRDLADPPVVVEASVSCGTVDRELRSRWSTTSVLVRGGAGGPRLGIVSRDAFMSTMTGQYGYGRALWEKRPVAEVTDWSPRLIADTAPLTEAAAMLTTGARKETYHDLVVVDAAMTPVGVLRPTAVMEALADRFARHASRDALTGLSSRASFHAGLGQMCDFAREAGHALLLAYIDLDRLKEVNDTRGHTVGDALLRGVAHRLAAGLGPDELLGRLGGDEFAVARLVAAPDATRGREESVRALVADAHALGERLRATITDLAGHGGVPAEGAVPGPRTTVGPADTRASIGIALTTSVFDRDDLLQHADLTMYAAKRAGGDAVRVSVLDVASRGAHARGPRASGGFVLGMGADGLPCALPLEGRLEVHFQPIVDTTGGAIRSVEALLRHRTPDGELQGPGGPLALAAQDDLGLELDLWVLGQAAQAVVAWRRVLGPAAPEHLDVNLSPAALRAPDLARRVRGVVERAHLPATSLRLEIPEVCSYEEVVAARPALEELRATGVLVTLDDVGSALTSVRHLTGLAVDGIKIDRWLVDGLRDEPGCAALVELMVELAASRGLAVTAEGVEHGHQLTALRRLGVDHVQGFHIARPMPAHEVVAWIGATDAASVRPPAA